MTPDIFAEWLRRRGHIVLRTESSYWYDQGFRVYQAFPYHWVLQPSETELSEFLKIVGGIGLRFSTTLGALRGCISYHIVSKESPYDISLLDKNTRYNIRLGLKNCHIEKISFENLAYQGWELQEDTLKRQGREKSMNFESWKRLCLSAQGLPGFEAWGAIIKGNLGASAIVCQIEDWCYVLYSLSHHKYFPLKINNAINYIITKEILGRPEINYLLRGVHSLDAPPTLDDFKFRMGYIPKPVRQRVVFHPWLQPLVNSLSHGIIKKSIAFKQGHPTLAKAEGMMRFYLEGLKPLKEQQWPACLEDNQEQILATAMNGHPRRTIS